LLQQNPNVLLNRFLYCKVGSLRRKSSCLMQIKFILVRHCTKEIYSGTLQMFEQQVCLAALSVFDLVNKMIQSRQGDLG
jgi:hypothetical protein